MNQRELDLKNEMYETKGEFESINFSKTYDALDSFKKVINDFEYNKKALKDYEVFKDLRNISIFKDEHLVDEYDKSIETLVSNLKYIESSIEGVFNDFLETDEIVISRIPKE